MEKIWGIPFLNLSGIPPEDITAKIELSNPKIILSSIEDISREEIQSQLQLLKIAYVAIDESQVDILIGYLLDQKLDQQIKS